jgi:hypothetical protein
VTFITDEQLAKDLHEFLDQRAGLFLLYKLRLPVDVDALTHEITVLRRRIAIRAVQLGLDDLYEFILNPTQL